MTILGCRIQAALLLFLVSGCNALQMALQSTAQPLDKNIFLYWSQGWDKAPWLQKEVAESWKINNPDWTVILLDDLNLENYTGNSDPYWKSPSKKIQLQAISDIIRVTVLKNHGGVWADATLLCMQPLNHWVYDAIAPSGIWMYHGHGAGLPSDKAPASWFIVSSRNGYMISQWKEAVDAFWANRSGQKYAYFWLDGRFRHLMETDEKFAALWKQVPYLYGHSPGQASELIHHCMQNNDTATKEAFASKPPYVLKTWKKILLQYPTQKSCYDSKKCQDSNLMFAIRMSKTKHVYKHPWAEVVHIDHTQYTCA